MTRVNAASFVTGAYPETHGLLGNDIYVPSANALKGLDTGERVNLEAVARAEGQLLTAPTLGEILQRAGKKLLGVSSGSTGSALLLNHTVGSGAIIHYDYTLPPALGARVLAALGPAPPARDAERSAEPARHRRLPEVRDRTAQPDVTLMWLNDPDGTAHANGIGSPLTRQSLTLVDAGIGRIEDTLRAEGRLGQTNIIVTSDHGFSTQTSALHALRAGRAVREEDGRWLAGHRRRGRRRSICAATTIRAGCRRSSTALQRRPEVGAIFTSPRRLAQNAATGQPAGGAAFEGVVPGTLSFDVARWNHARSGDILVSANWTRDSERRRLCREDDAGGRCRARNVEPVRHSQHADRRRPRLPRARDERDPDGQRRPRADAAAAARRARAGDDDRTRDPRRTPRRADRVLRAGRARGRDGQDARRRLRTDRAHRDCRWASVSRPHRGRPALAACSNRCGHPSVVLGPLFLVRPVSLVHMSRSRCPASRTT